MADQRIKLVISGREYPMEADSPQTERLMRLAAEEVDKLLNDLGRRYAGTSFEDKLMIVAVQKAASNLLLQKKLQDFESETAALGQELDAYLEGEEEK